MTKLQMSVCILLAALGLAAAHPDVAQARTLEVAGMGKPLSWIHAPVDYKLTRTGIAIKVPGKTDKYIAAGGGYAPDSATRLVFDDSDRDFVFSVRVSHKFASVWDSGGLVVEQDATHWFKFEFERDYTGAHRVVSVVTKDFSDDDNSIAIDSDTAYLEVARTGDAFYLYASQDGKSWYLVRAFNFKSAGPLKAGLIAQCPNGNGATLHFSDVKYTATHIKDIWKGQ